jgi:hypothetical protein
MTAIGRQAGIIKGASYSGVTGKLGSCGWLSKAYLK